MRGLISADMEGATGVACPDDCRPGSQDAAGYAPGAALVAVKEAVDRGPLPKPPYACAVTFVGTSSAVIAKLGASATEPRYG